MSTEQSSSGEPAACGGITPACAPAVKSAGVESADVPRSNSGGGAEKSENPATVPPPESTIDVGEGFEQLKVGTIRKEGDEWKDTDGVWRKVVDSIGYSVKSLDAPNRRKLPAPAPVPSAKELVKALQRAEQAVAYHPNDRKGKPDSPDYVALAEASDKATAALLAHITKAESAAATWEKLAVELAEAIPEAIHNGVKTAEAAYVVTPPDQVGDCIQSELDSIIARIDAAKKEQSNG